MTGDMLGENQEIGPLLDLIALMPAQTPKYYIPGDTDGDYLDSFAHSSLSVYTEWAERLQEAGVKILDRPVSETRGKGTIWFVPEEVYTLDLDPAKIGKSLTAYTLVVLDQNAREEDLVALLSEDPDVTECHAVTGEYDFLLKIFARDIDSFEEKILRLKDRRLVSKTHTLFSLRERKYLPGACPDETDAEDRR